MTSYAGRAIDEVTPIVRFRISGGPVKRRHGSRFFAPLAPIGRCTPSGPGFIPKAHHSVALSFCPGSSNVGRRTCYRAAKRATAPAAFIELSPLSTSNKRQPAQSLFRAAFAVITLGASR
jgi:hypothetical protein